LSADRPSKRRPESSSPPRRRSDEAIPSRSRPTSEPNRGKRSGSTVTRAANAIKIKRVGMTEYELLHPRAVLERADDLEEAQAMVAAGEIEIAIDELRYLLSGCHDFIDAHRMLGELALAEDDLHLARGHFGIAYQLGLKAIGDLKGTLPARLPANQSFHESGKGLIWCLGQLGKLDLAAEAADRLVQLDPSDPLGIRRLLGTLTKAPG
jgi:tetratricopeptide (TPR) repeat protein